jgi:predicted AlkP superfamily pyrophosphatase or phosphodiesterase
VRPVLLLDLVGLTPRQIGSDTPNLAALAQRGSMAPMGGILPGVTCSAQATMLTGSLPSQHGAVANGWRLPSTGEVNLWRQHNALVEGEKIYEAARRRDPKFTCAKLFWWWNLGAPVDLSITPRPFYPADGRKIPAIYSWPTRFGAETEAELGAFPFFDFWGPKAGLPSSRWIADAALRTLERERPDLVMAYLPHLDYDHQRFGPTHPRSVKALRDLDVIVGDLVRGADAHDAAVVAVSEYGIMPVDRPVHINLALRKAGLLEVRVTPNGEVLDIYGSRAFAMSDHQIAHIYCQDEAAERAARKALEELPGVEQVLAGSTRAEAGLDHPNAGQLVAVSDARSWFTYYYWEGRDAEPDFARTVDIHRKPGYDPCEMFLDPALRFPMLRIARRVAQKKLGMRYAMDVIPVNAELVKGSHGRLADDPLDGPVWLSSLPFDQLGGAPDDGQVAMTSVKQRVLAALERE